MTKYTDAQTVAVLRKAAMLIKKGFTKGTCARGAEGWEVFVHSKTACSFCTLGALIKVAKDDSHPVFNYATDCLQRQKIPGVAFLSTWNDKPERTKEDVVTFLRACARKLQAKAKKAL